MRGVAWGAQVLEIGGAASERTRGLAPAALTAIAERLEAEHDRWFLWLPVLFGAGIAVYFALSFEPLTTAAVLPAVAALALHAAGPRAGIAGLVTGAILAATLGVAAAKLRTEAMRAPVLQTRMGLIDVYGHVELIEPRATGGQRVTLRVTAMEKHETETWPARVRVRMGVESAALQPGDHVRVKATLSPPPGPALPGDYDFARAAWFMRLGAVGFSRSAMEPVESAIAPPFSLQVSAVVARVRQAIGRRMLAALPGETGAIANALITGERGGIPEATNQAFRDSGLFHVLSISGLHMVVMAGAVFLSIRLMLSAIPSIALRYPIKKWAAAGAMLGAFGYLQISGAAVPTVRSAIMISIMFLAVILDRPALALRNVALSALLILAVWPESLLDAGFQMSFAAVVALVSAYEWLRERFDRSGDVPRRGMFAGATLFFGGIVTSTLVAGLAVAPFGIYHFHNTQQFAILANLLAIPICNLIVMPAGLAALVMMPLGVEALPLWVMGQGIDAMVWCANVVARIPGAVGRVPAIPTAAFGLMIAGGLWLTLWRTRWRLLGLVPMALGLMLAPTGSRPDVLIGRGGDLVAVRGEDGRLSAMVRRGGTFELARWLEHDGDGRPASEAAKGQAFSCDRVGCVARVKGALVAVSESAAALRDDCAAASVLILKFAKPTGCRPPGPVIDSADLKAEGAHALTLENGRVRIETAAQARGVRPWSGGADGDGGM